MRVLSITIKRGPEAQARGTFAAAGMAIGRCLTAW